MDMEMENDPSVPKKPLTVQTGVVYQPVCQTSSILRTKVHEIYQN